jgi:hypothetical protein
MATYSDNYQLQFQMYEFCCIVQHHIKATGFTSRVKNASLKLVMICTGLPVSIQFQRRGQENKQNKHISHPLIFTCLSAYLHTAIVTHGTRTIPGYC